MTDPLDRFFDHYYRRRPVNATFTGIHDYDGELPDWSLAGLAAMDAEMRSIRDELGVAYPAPNDLKQFRNNARLLDAELARGFLDIQLAENASRHGPRGNPALWTGEAALSMVPLMIRDFAPIEQRVESAMDRLDAIPDFLRSAATTLGASPIPSVWIDRALRDCDGAKVLLTEGILRWQATLNPGRLDIVRLHRTALAALVGFMEFRHALSLQASRNASESCGEALYDLLLERGHHCTVGRGALFSAALAEMELAQQKLEELVQANGGSLAAVQERLAADHPEPDDYLAAFGRVWQRSYECAAKADVVTWPDWPIRYTLIPEVTRGAAPDLYYLYYRSPAPFDPYDVYDYAVPQLPVGKELAHLRAWNHSVITLNHVVHHGGIGHHVQNWFAYHRASTRIGRVAAVDCATRIGMFLAGTMAEGWACYATDLMDELGFLSPLQAVAQQHARVRMLARAIVDIELHQGTMSFAAAVGFYMDTVGMTTEAARAEATKNSMFPCTAIMYWLGTRGIHDLRAELRQSHGSRFSLRAFHDELLGYGSIPVPLIARMLSPEVGA